MLRKDKKRKARGWVPFGYRYLGPGNDLHSGQPTTTGDKAAQKHDWQYDELAKRFKRDPKYFYSEADDDFINEVGTKHTSEWIAKHLFQVKRKFAELGIIDDIRPYQKSKRETSTNDWKQFVTPPSFNNKRKREISPFGKIKARRVLLPSLLNIQEEDNMSGPNQGSGTEAGLTETPVDQVTQVFRGPPDHTFCSLPYFDEFSINQNCWVHDYAYRPTSVYDCKVDQGTNEDLNVGTGAATYYKTLPFNSSDATIDKARWFDFYAGIYKYYHVIACKYEIYIENQTNDDIYVHLMPTNDVYPPINATNTDMMQWNDCESRLLTGRAYAITNVGTKEQSQVNSNVEMSESAAAAGSGNNYETSNHLINELGSKATVFRGTYRTGDYSRQVRLDANVENWTQTNTNPTLVERLLLRFKQYWDSYPPAVGDTGARDRAMRVKIRSRMEYLVEFKELRDGLKYPVNSQPYTVTINQNN